MPIDMRQFHQTFFEESLEGLAVMEAALLRLESAQRDGQVPTELSDRQETLNVLFRAVHSIKGASGTFGYVRIAEFSHRVESLMDSLRSGTLTMSDSVIGILLASVDQLRVMIHVASENGAGNATNPPAVDELCRRIEDLLQVRSGAPTRHDAVPAKAASQVWRIEFKPAPNLFARGNDPVRIFRELSQLGPVSAEADIGKLPAWSDFDPEVCYLSWQLILNAAVSRETVAAAFEWVLDDCHLRIEPAPLPPDATVAPGSPATGNVGATDEHVSSIRVGIAKVDTLINMVGELVITQAMLSELSANFTPEKLPRLLASVAQLERNTRDLQESVMRIRMLPIGFVFNRLPRLVRDSATQLGKKIKLVINGERTELDKTVIERIGDPLMHLVRNGIDHGIELPAERRAAGKPEQGTIHVDAYQMGGNVVVELRDDGRGLNRERILAKAVERGLVAADQVLSPADIDQLIFVPGLSTAEVVSELSGRGVGMDVVRNNIHSLGGSVDVQSEDGKGVRFTIRLPLTLAIVEGLSVQVGEQIYIIPLVSIAESISITPQEVSRPAGGPELFSLRNSFVPLVRLYQVFNVPPRHTELEEGILVVVESNGRRAGIFVDELLGQQQVVIKNLAAHYQKVDGVSGATILGDGSVALILDVDALVSAAQSGAYRVLGSVSAPDGRGAQASWLN